MLKIKSTVPRERAIIVIGCKYNTWNVLYFISTEDTGRMKYCIHYLSMHPDPFSNFSILSVAFLL